MFARAVRPCARSLRLAAAAPRASVAAAATPRAAAPRAYSTSHSSHNQGSSKYDTNSDGHQLLLVLAAGGALVAALSLVTDMRAKHTAPDPENSRAAAEEVDEIDEHEDAAEGQPQDAPSEYMRTHDVRARHRGGTEVPGPEVCFGVEAGGGVGVHAALPETVGAEREPLPGSSARGLYRVEALGSEKVAALAGRTPPLRGVQLASSLPRLPALCMTAAAPASWTSASECTSPKLDELRGTYSAMALHLTTPWSLPLSPSATSPLPIALLALRSARGR